MTPFIGDPRLPPLAKRRSGPRLCTAAEPNFTLALATLTSKLKRRSLVVLFSDFTDPTSRRTDGRKPRAAGGQASGAVRHHADSEIEQLVTATPAISPRSPVRSPPTACPSSASWC
jgi:hypothetical protein